MNCEEITNKLIAIKTDFDHIILALDRKESIDSGISARARIEKIFPEIFGPEIDEARGLRLLKKVLSQNVFKESVAAREEIAKTLVGCDSEEAWTLRDELKDEGVDPLAILSGLAGVDSPRAWEIRQQHEEDIRDLSQSLVGLDTEEAWAYRDKIGLKGGWNNNMDSIVGCNSDTAWELRQDCKTFLHDDYLLWSLAGLDTDRAWQFRAGMEDKAILPSLIGVEDPRAWEIRERLWNSLRPSDRALSTPADLIARSLKLCDSERAWQFRERFTLRQKLRSIAGLNSVKAWKIRTNALKSEEDSTTIFFIFESVFGDAQILGARIAKRISEEENA